MKMHLGHFRKNMGYFGIVLVVFISYYIITIIISHSTDSAPHSGPPNTRQHLSLWLVRVNYLLLCRNVNILRWYWHWNCSAEFYFKFWNIFRADEALSWIKNKICLLLKHYSSAPLKPVLNMKCICYVYCTL